MKDINNPLEDIKVQSALRSQEMSLSYRQVNKPKEINILDYTVIAALEKQISFKPNFHQLGDYIGLHYCEICNSTVCEEDNYCKSCGQKLDWS